MAKTLLIIDDDAFFCKSLMTYFHDAPFNVVSANTGEAGLQWCKKNQADVVLLDQKLPDTMGTSLCEPILDLCEQAKIIFITAFPSFDHAVQALRNGAFDYLSKPMELEALRLAIEKAFRSAELERLEVLHNFKNQEELKRNQVIGFAGGLKSISQLVELAASSRAPVLITGETGTGKNVIAKATHYMSKDNTLPFIGVNCAALPENLIESELFGHEKGAFTGAEVAKKGLFELADGGTIFLDEIGELPMHLQTKLLGVLDDGSFRRIGGEITRNVDVRIIAATNIEIENAISKNRFREDLYYRLGVLMIEIPPLRQRIEDIEPLCLDFLKKMAADQNLLLPKSEIDLLGQYPWPGNVRELKNTIERSILLRKGQTIYPSRLMTSNESIRLDQSFIDKKYNDEESLQSLEQMEKTHIISVLQLLDNNQTQAAKVLGIARSTLIRKISYHNIS